MRYGVVVTVTGYILISILSETMSIIIFLIFLPKRFNFNSKDLVPDFGTVKDVLTIGLPCTSSRLIGNIGYLHKHPQHEVTVYIFSDLNFVLHLEELPLFST